MALSKLLIGYVRDSISELVCVHPFMGCGAPWSLLSRNVQRVREGIKMSALRSLESDGPPASCVCLIGEATEAVLLLV